MERKTLFPKVFALILVALLLAGCGGAPAGPVETSTPVPQAAMLTPVPPTPVPATFTPVPPTATPAPPPTPTPPLPTGPKPGHWEGVATNPYRQVSFDITGDGKIKSFEMIVAWNSPTNMCTITQEEVRIETDRSFSFVTKLDTKFGKLSAQEISGEFDGETTVTGTYAINACIGSQLGFQIGGSGQPTTWTAEWRQP